jgi:hypothetical protein
MRAVFALSNASGGTVISQVLRWLQAGFSSFAYRSAHLSLPRPLVVCAVALLTYVS